LCRRGLALDQLLIPGDVLLQYEAFHVLEDELLGGAFIAGSPHRYQNAIELPDQQPPAPRPAQIVNFN